MKKTFFILLIILVMAVGVFGQSPRLIYYQGTLTDSLNTPLPDTTYYLTFRVYDDSTGITALWESARNIPVHTQNGHYDYPLGSTSPLPDSLVAYRRLWLEIEIENKRANKSRVLLVYDFIAPACTSAVMTPGIATPEEETGEVISFDPRNIKIPVRESDSTRPRSNNNKSKLLVRADYNWPGKIKIGNDPKYSVNSGFAGGVEILWIDSKNSSMAGLGMEYQLSRSIKDYNIDFRFTSFWGTVRINIPLEKGATTYPYFVGRLGFNIFSNFDDDNGLTEEPKLTNGPTIAGGLGLNFNDRFICEAVYRINNGKFEDYKVKYSGFSLTLGVFANLSM
jgi:hypothetical protein